MKRYLNFVKKEFLHIFRDPRTLVVLFGIPIMQIMIFGYVITNEFKDIRVAVVDQSKDEQAQQLLNKIWSSGFFLYDQTVGSATAIEERFKNGKARAGIIIPANFEQELTRSGYASIQIITDASDPNLANTIVNYLSGIIRQYQNDMSVNNQNQAMISIETRMHFNENLEGAFMFVPGTMALILMIICALLTSISVTREKEFGTMEVLLVSPLRPFQIILGKLTPYIGLAFLNALVILVLGNTVFGLPIAGSLVLLLLEMLLYILMALSLGILISTMAPNQQVAMFMSLFALMLPTILLSGFIFPIENMPAVLQWLSLIIPPRWFIIIVKDIMLKGNGLAFIWDETLILLGMTVLFILVAIRKFKVRLEQ